jgi:hypothetical protein
MDFIGFGNNEINISSILLHFFLLQSVLPVYTCPFPIDQDLLIERFSQTIHQL